MTVNNFTCLLCLQSCCLILVYISQLGTSCKCVMDLFAVSVSACVVCQIPPYSDVDIQVYLQHCQSSPDFSRSRLYDAGFLKFVRFAKTDDKVFIHSQCKAEMRKAVTYAVDIVTHTDANILECQCECPAGMGPNANCKHVRAVLCSLCDFTSTKTVKTETTCTQWLQTFHKSRPYFGSPVKAHGLHQQKGPSKTGLVFDPRPEGSLTGVAYQAFVRNLTINFAASTTQTNSGLNMPLLQLYGPANPYAIENDHDYGEMDNFGTFLLKNHVTCITAEAAADIEHKTRGQARNSQWHAERSLRLCSSNFGRICKASPSASVNLAKSLVCQYTFDSRSLRHGRMNEQPALCAYAKATGNVVRSSGLVVSQAHPFIAATPDGLVGDFVTVEVKCPYVSRLKPVNPVTVPFLCEADGELTVKKDHDYYFQIQGQLYATKRVHCELVVYTLVDMKVITVERDNSFISKMTDKLVTFFIEFFKPALKHRYFYRGYDALLCDCTANQQ